MHSSMQVWHIAMHASSIAIIDAGVMPCMRIIERIIVLHMSAQFMHAGAHDIICVEHTVHACSQAEQASIQACRMDMSIVAMPGIDIMSLDIASIIMESIAHLASVSSSASRSARLRPMLDAAPRGMNPLARLDQVLSQGIHTTRRARLSAVVAGLVAAAVLLLAPASPASAHDELLGSDPAAGATLDALPGQLTLTFSDAIATDEGASEVAVTDASGASLIGGAPSAQDNVLTQPLSGEASGEITVLWKVVSSDGHPISGEFAFTVTAPPTPTETAAPPTPTETVAPTPTPTELTDDMSVDWGATLLANLLPVLLGAAILGGAIVAILLAVRRRRPPSSTPDPDSRPPAEG